MRKLESLYQYQREQKKDDHTKQNDNDTLSLLHNDKVSIIKEIKL